MSDTLEHHHRKPEPDDERSYFEQLTKAVFQAGMSWKVVEAKWDGFRRDFRDFDPHAIAAMTAQEIARIEEDPAVIRNRRKIEATVENAKTMVALIDQHGTFADYLHSFATPEDVQRDLEDRFRFVGDTGSWWFLRIVGEPTPT